MPRMRVRSRHGSRRHECCTVHSCWKVHSRWRIHRYWRINDIADTLTSNTVNATTITSKNTTCAALTASSATIGTLDCTTIKAAHLHGNVVECKSVHCDELKFKAVLPELSCEISTPIPLMSSTIVPLGRYRSLVRASTKHAAPVRWCLCWNCQSLNRALNSIAIHSRYLTMPPLLNLLRTVVMRCTSMLCRPPPMQWNHQRPCLDISTTLRLLVMNRRRRMRLSRRRRMRLSRRRRMRLSRRRRMRLSRRCCMRLSRRCCMRLRSALLHEAADAANAGNANTSNSPTTAPSLPRPDNGNWKEALQ